MIQRPDPKTHPRGFVCLGLLAAVIVWTVAPAVAKAGAQQVFQFTNADRTSHFLRDSGNKKGYQLKRVFSTAPEEPGGETRLTYKEHLSRFDAVFMGYVKEKIEKLKGNPYASPEEIRDWDKKDTRGLFGWPVEELYYVFSIEKAFKGVEGESVEMFYESTLSIYPCVNLEIRLGSRFLVYGMMDREKKQFVVTCYTKPVEDADVEMMFFTALANEVDEARIYTVLPHVAKTHSRGKTRADALQHLKNAPGEIKLPDLKDTYVFSLRDHHQGVRDVAVMALARVDYLHDPKVLGQLIFILSQKDRPISPHAVRALAIAAYPDSEIVSQLQKKLEIEKKYMEKMQKQNKIRQSGYHRDKVHAISNLLKVIKELKN